jgi:flagellar hook-basal body complex protein FliE
MDSIIDPNVAMNAYGTTKNIALKGDAVKSADDGGVSFSYFLKQKAQDSVETMRNSEQMSVKAVTGDADITDVVQAVTAAELTLQTVVSVRDRLISAYQEIMRMPI